MNNYLRFSFIIIVLTAFLSVKNTCAIVLHPQECDPNSKNPQNPPPNFVARWAKNASCVLISPNCVITTKHQGGGVGTIVEIDDTPYRVERIWNHPGIGNPSDEDYGLVDLRIGQLADANFVDYSGLYTQRDEVEIEGDIVIGGFGVGRGSLLETTGIVYGYAWEDEAVGNNEHLRWCTNRIDEAVDDLRSTSQKQVLMIHDILSADFDGPCETVNEGIVAEYDSGGGWFVDVDGEWKLAGLTWGVEHAERREALFMSRIFPTNPRPDEMYALRVSSYAEWVRDVLEEACRFADCGVDMDDAAELAGHWLKDECSEANSYCYGWDVNRDGFVDFVDFGVFAGNFVIERNG